MEAAFRAGNVFERFRTNDERSAWIRTIALYPEFRALKRWTTFA